MSFQIELGMRNNYICPQVLTDSPLLHWNISHSVTKVRMVFFIPSRKKEWLAWACVFWNPKRPIIAVECNSFNILGLSDEL